MIKFIYDDYQAMDFALLLMQTEGKWGLVNNQGVAVTKTKYDQIMPFVERRARVKVGNLWGYINSEDKEITPVHYYHSEDFMNGKAAVSRNKKAGFIDLNGKERWQE